MIIIFIILIFLTTFYTLYFFLGVLSKNRAEINFRLEKLKVPRNKDDIDELSLPFYQRIIKPMGDNLSDIITNITPGGLKNKIDEKLTIAGNPYNIGPSQWLLIKGALLIFVPVIILTFTFFTGKFSAKNIGILVVGMILAFLFPNLLLSQITKKRQKEIVNTLPDVLDLLTVSVEAGLSFDGALARLIQKFNGELSKEFGRVLNEMRMGRSRKEALKEMINRCGVMDVTTFIGALIQADELGVGISNVLRIQSEQMRQKRRQRAQEKAMKAPIKMLFPLVFFIFPTLFAVLLGPAIIKIMNEFMK